VGNYSCSNSCMDECDDCLNLMIARDEGNLKLYDHAGGVSVRLHPSLCLCLHFGRSSRRMRSGTARVPSIGDLFHLFSIQNFCNVINTANDQRDPAHTHIHTHTHTHTQFSLSLYFLYFIISFTFEEECYNYLDHAFRLYLHYLS